MPFHSTHLPSGESKERGRERKRTSIRLFASFIVTAIFATLLVQSPVAAQSSVPTCQAGATDPDGDGWGWDEATRTSCRVVDDGGSDVVVCVDSDGDGWGWDEASSSSCRVSDSGGSAPAPSEPSGVVCVDSDGDGWGWDEASSSSCRVSDSGAPVSAQPPAVTAAPEAAIGFAADRTGLWVTEELQTTLRWTLEPGSQANVVEISRPGMSVQVTELDSFVISGRLFHQWLDGPHEPGTADHDVLGSGAALEYTIRVGYTNGSGDTSWSAPSSVTVDTGPYLVDEPDEIAPHVFELVDELFVDSSLGRRNEIARLLWETQFRVENDVDAEWSKLRALHELLSQSGNTNPGIPVPISSTPQQELNADQAALVENLLIAPPTESVAEVVPAQSDTSLVGLRITGSEITERLAADLQTSFDDLGWSADLRGTQFERNQVELDNLIAALPSQPGRGDAYDFEMVEEASFRQAEYVLNINVDHRDHLWDLRTAINIGVFPTTTQLNPEEGRGRFIQIATETPFSRRWNEATIEARAEYFGIDPVLWSIADRYLELSLQMDDIHDDLEDWFRPLAFFAIAITIGIVTGGLGSAGYAAIVGGAATSTVAVAVGGAIGAYASTFFLTGSTAAAEKAAWSSLLTAGIAHYLRIPVGERTWQQNIGLAILDGGVEVVGDGDFFDGFTESLVRSYVPGLSQNFQNSAGEATLLSDLSSLLIVSYIRNDGDWDKIGDDLENLVRQEFGGFVTDLVGDELPQEWGEFGTAIANIAGVAASDPNDERAIFNAVATNVGPLVGGAFGERFGEDGWQEQLATGVTMIVIRAQAEDDPGAYIDQQLTELVLDVAGEEVSSALGDQLVRFNGGESSPWIDAGVGLINVVVSNLWREPAALEAVIRQHVGNVVITEIEAAFPQCIGGTWIEGVALNLIDVTLGSLTNGDNGEQVGANIAGVLESAAGEVGQFDGFGTCGQQNLEVQDNDSSPPASSTCSGEVVEVRANFTPTLEPKIAAVTPAGIVGCGTATVFRDWLLEMDPAEIDQLVSYQPGIFFNITSVNGATEDGYGISQYRLALQATSIEGQIEEYRGDSWAQVGQTVFVRRDGNRIIDFVPAAEFEPEEIPNLETETRDAFAVVRGCISAVTQSWSEFREAVIELWQAEDLAEYVAVQWESFQRMRAAFEHNPEAFIEQFLAGLFQIELLEENWVEWAGFIFCELVMGIVPGYAATRFAPVFKAFKDDEGLKDFTGNNPRTGCDISIAFKGGISGTGCGNAGAISLGLATTVGRSIGNPANTVEFDVNSAGQTVAVRAEIAGVYRTERDGDSAELAAQGRVEGKVAGDHAGHLVGYRFLGAQGDINLVPQNGNLNQGAFKRVENEIADFVNAGATVELEVRLSGYDANGRPSTIDIEYEAFAGSGPNRVKIDTGGGLGAVFRNEAGQTYQRLDSEDIKILVRTYSRT